MLEQRSILVVDDEPVLRDGIAEMFCRSGYACRTAKSGEDALFVFREFPSQAVLSDVLMAGMDGLEVTRNVLEYQPETAVVLMSGKPDAAVAIEALRSGASDFLLKPFGFRAAERSVEQAIFKKQATWQTNQELVRLQYLLQGLRFHSHALTESLIQSLCRLQQMRDVETYAHVRRVSHCACVLARKMGLSAEEEEALRIGALLHDIGKVIIPDQILQKPGPLTEKEWGRMKLHVETGYRLLSGIPGLQEPARIVREHHESYGGGGYPRGLRDEEICLGARIFAVADSYDAMTNDRPYRKGQSPSIAREELQRCAGAMYDPNVVAAFLEIPESEWLPAPLSPEYNLFDFLGLGLRERGSEKQGDPLDRSGSLGRDLAVPLEG